MPIVFVTGSVDGVLVWSVERGLSSQKSLVYDGIAGCKTQQSLVGSSNITIDRSVAS